MGEKGAGMISILLLASILIPAGYWIRRQVQSRPLIDDRDEVVVTGLFED